MKDKILIYGANGYMGKLSSEFATRQQLPIILAGRSAFRTDKPSRIFSLENKEEILNNLTDILLVINLAGPFNVTNVPLLEACIDTKTHYIDIAGEAPEIETVFEYHQKATVAGIMLMPGAGFGVVPTDIVANLAKEKLPDATHLKIAYVTEGGVSRGTLQTVLKNTNEEGVIIKNGLKQKAMPAFTTFSFAAEGKNNAVVYNPWRADLFTAQVSTGIKTIETFSAFPSFIVKMMQGRMLWLRDFILKRLIGFLPEGPSAKQLKKGKTICFAEVKNENGDKATVTLIGPEAYMFSVLTLIEISKRIAKGDFKTGFQTPNIYGYELISSFDNIELI